MPTPTFKELIETYGKQIGVTVTHGNTIYTSADIYSCNISYEGNILTSVMKQAEIEIGGQNLSFANSMKGESISITFTVTVGSNSASKSYGTFIVKDSEYDDATGIVKLICYDLLLKSMIPYTSVCDFQTTVTLGDYLQYVCNYLGLTLTTTTFTNSTVVVDEEKYDSQYTFRDVLTEIAQAAGGTIAIKNDALSVLYPAASGYTVDPSNLKSLKINELYGPVNSVVIARTPQEDNIYKRDETATSWIEVKIENNQIMDSHREDFIDNLYSRLSGLSYYAYEIESYGMGYLDVCDTFTLKTLDNTTYSTIWLNSNLEISQGVSESAKVELPTYTKTDYAAADTTDRRINQTILKVDKQEQKITALVTSTEQKTNELTNEVEAVKNTVSQTMTSEQVQILVQQEVEGKNSITTETGYTFNQDGLTIHKTGEEMTNLIDNTGMYVRRDSEDILTANNEGVNALNLTARQFLIVGANSRFEDYETDRTACFFIG